MAYLFQIFVHHRLSLDLRSLLGKQNTVGPEEATAGPGKLEANRGGTAEYWISPPDRISLPGRERSKGGGEGLRINRWRLFVAIHVKLTDVI